MYIRKSKEALSEPIFSNNKNRQIDGLDIILERALKRAIQQSQQQNNSSSYNSQKLKEDYETVSKYIDDELSHNNELSPKEKQSYIFLQNVVTKDKEKLEDIAEEVEDEEIKELRKRLRRLQLTLAELKQNKNGSE